MLRVETAMSMREGWCLGYVDQLEGVRRVMEILMLCGEFRNLVNFTYVVS